MPFNSCLRWVSVNSIQPVRQEAAEHRRRIQCRPTEPAPVPSLTAALLPWPPPGFTDASGSRCDVCQDKMMCGRGGWKGLWLGSCTGCSCRPHQNLRRAPPPRAQHVPLASHLKRPSCARPAALPRYHCSHCRTEQRLRRPGPSPTLNHPPPTPPGVCVHVSRAPPAARTGLRGAAHAQLAASALGGGLESELSASAPLAVSPRSPAHPLLAPPSPSTPCSTMRRQAFLFALLCLLLVTAQAADEEEE